MLIKCDSVLLLTSDESLIKTYKELADTLCVHLTVTDKWNINYRVTEDVVICDSDKLKSVNARFYMRTVVVLSADEEPFDYLYCGFSRFIYSVKDIRQLQFAFYFDNELLSKVRSRDTKSISSYVSTWSVKEYKAGKYDFSFSKNLFSYEGKRIRLTKSQKMYLADWLLKGYKSSAKRAVLYQMRLAIGKSFLTDIDKNGKLMEDRK